MKDYKKLSREHFNKQADKYDQRNTRNYSYYPKISCQDVAERLKEVKYESLLDIGCGTGYLFEILDNALEKDLTGLDISPEMLKVAKNKFGGKVNLVLGSAEKLPFEDESFDVITCIQSFHHYPFPDETMQEVFRVLKPGGQFILSDTGAGGPIKRLYNSLFLKLVNSGDYKIYESRDIENLMRHVGFKSISSYQIKPAVYTIIGVKNYNLNWFSKTEDSLMPFGKVKFFDETNTSLKKQLLSL